MVTESLIPPHKIEGWRMPEAISLNHLSRQVQSPRVHRPLSKPKPQLPLSHPLNYPASDDNLDSTDQKFHSLELKNKVLTHSSDLVFPLIPKLEIEILEDLNNEIQMCPGVYHFLSYLWHGKQRSSPSKEALSLSLLKNSVLEGQTAIIEQSEHPEITKNY